MSAISEQQRFKTCEKEDNTDTGILETWVVPGVFCREAAVQLVSSIFVRFSKHTPSGLAEPHLTLYLAQGLRVNQLDGIVKARLQFFKFLVQECSTCLTLLQPPASWPSPTLRSHPCVCIVPRPIKLLGPVPGLTTAEVAARAGLCWSTWHIVLEIIGGIRRSKTLRACCSAGSLKQLDTLVFFCHSQGWCLWQLRNQLRFAKRHWPRMCIVLS
ncbi:hypothetical protein IWX90DRAFT_34403 [Phyllosticta citrichinensis]|uniref:Uncharacterized protein n=1 Tax=Phyllosticta citrichinensis TaxID=1130410 RepID=A0ABR1Y7J8_9PEZI